MIEGKIVMDLLEHQRWLKWKRWACELQKSANELSRVMKEKRES